MLTGCSFIHWPFGNLLPLCGSLQVQNSFLYYVLLTSPLAARYHFFFHVNKRGYKNNTTVLLRHTHEEYVASAGTRTHLEHCLRNVNHTLFVFWVSFLSVYQDDFCLLCYYYNWDLSYAVWKLIFLPLLKSTIHVPVF